ncbi:MAG: carboxypeptidase regulatory-like domain-containing protein [Candidatus Cryptobacteroides sp.]
MTVFSASAQVTTSALSGSVTDENQDPLAGAAIVAVHIPSGTQYAAIANAQGRFNINGMRSGGPYTVEVSFLGMGTVRYTDVTLTLGEPYTIDVVMKASNELDAVVLTAEGSFNASKTGAGANFNLSAVENMPTIDRSIYDIVKYTPQASVNKDGGISFAGSNNRYNSFQIDGAVANDSFGLAASGTNGGQTGANPVALDAIEEIQVVVAPFDVRQSGFTGGAINAITKSGTNTVKGSAYAYFNNQDFIGTTPGANVENRKKYDSQNTQTYGFTIGAPIVKNKLFIFASAEYYRKSYPNIYTPENNTYETEKMKLSKPVYINGVQHEYFDSEVAQAIIDHYSKTYHNGNAVAESFGQHQVKSQSINAMLRLDWNINDRNKMMLRYQLMDAYSDKYSSGSSSYYFNNSSYKMSDLTNTIVLELNSRPSEKVANEFRATAVLVRDKRDVAYPGANMYIKDKVYVNIGTEYSSGANAMNSDTYTISDNVFLYAGNHTITLGTHNEIYRFNNLFLQYAYGGYTFNSIADFFANKCSQFNYRYADTEVPGVDSPRWAATTVAAQFGLYAQDEWRPNRNFTLTYGVRMDIPVLLNKPTANEGFNATEISNNSGEKVGVVPKATPLFSPRIGFRWWMDKDHKALLRGGAGLFTGRVPFVWLSNAYNNTGVEAKSIQVNNPDADFPMTSNPFEDVVKTGAAAAGGKATINTLNRSFKYPQVFRVNLGYDHDFGYGWKLTVDALYSKTLNNVFFRNLALSNTAKVFAVNAATAEANPNSVANYYSVNRDYNAIVALENTNMGYTYSLSAMVNKHFNFGLDLMASYTFGHSYSVNDGSSSVALSNWQNYMSLDASSPTLSYSVFDKPHKVMGMISYTSPKYARILKTTVSLSYTGQSGNRYSYICKETADSNGDGVTNKGVLLYIPTQEELTKMNWATPQDALSYENFIRGDKYLNNHRGQYSERFGGIYPFENHFDFHVTQDFYYDNKHNRKVSVFVDFLNVGNLFNRAWGLYYTSSWTRQVLEITDIAKDADGNATPTYKFNSYDITFGDFYSRWRCQIGLRLTF